MYEDDDQVFRRSRPVPGYLLKGADRGELVRAIRSVSSGEAIFGPGIARRLMSFFAGRPAVEAAVFPELTDREREILDMVARGLSNTEITQRLVLSPKTVRNHVSNIFSKLQVADRAQAIVRAREAGLGGERRARRVARRCPGLHEYRAAVSRRVRRRVMPSAAPNARAVRDGGPDRGTRSPVHLRQGRPGPVGGGPRPVARTFAMRVYAATYWVLTLSFLYILVAVLAPAVSEDPSLAAVIPVLVVFLGLFVAAAAAATFLPSAPRRAWFWPIALIPDLGFFAMNGPYLPYAFSHPADSAFPGTVPLVVGSVILVLTGIAAFREVRSGRPSAWGSARASGRSRSSPASPSVPR
jgi:DNA-binding CsgD family transcriptional regulator